MIRLASPRRTRDTTIPLINVVFLMLIFFFQLDVNLLLLHNGQRAFRTMMDLLVREVTAEIKYWYYFFEGSR